MQSIQNEIFDGLQNKVNKAKQNLKTVWKESETSQAKAVIMLAEAMEELYVQSGNHEFVKNICQDIRHFVEQCGGSYPYHVDDYLHNFRKYKRDYELEDSSIGKEEVLHILGKNLLDIQQIDLKEVDIETKQKAFDVLCRFTDNIEKDAQEEHYALFKPNDSILDNFNTQYQDRKDITTPKPEPKETELSDAIQETIDALTELKKDAIEFPPA